MQEIKSVIELRKPIYVVYGCGPNGSDYFHEETNLLAVGSECLCDCMTGNHFGSYISECSKTINYPSISPVVIEEGKYFNVLDDDKQIIWMGYENPEDNKEFLTKLNLEYLERKEKKK